MSNDEAGEGDLGDDVSFDKAVAEAARAAEPVSIKGQPTPAQRVAKARAISEEERARQDKQNTIWRRVLFWSVSSLVVGIALFSTVIMALYLNATGPNASPAVLSTWFGSTVVQVVGLLLVITRHLFPNDRSK